MDIKLGFSTGALHKTGLTMKEKIRAIKDVGCNAIELSALKFEEFESYGLEKLCAEDLECFDFVSMHASKCGYGWNKNTKKVFDKIDNVNNIRKLDVVVFHSSNVINFDVFNNQNFVVAFENMEKRGKFGTTPKDIEEVLTQNEKFRMVLDISHAFVLDPTLNLAQDFYSKFKDKIAEIHLSGHIYFHEPLFKTKQVDIIKLIQDFNIPIIIESVITEKEIRKEYEYILNNIKTILKF